MMVASLRGALVALASVCCGACLFPEYTFDEPEPSGGSGGSTVQQGGQPVGAGGAGGVVTQGAGGVGGEGGSPPTEDCFTPGDEDDNGLADCANPACTVDLECVDAIPVGWGTFGYSALFRGAASADPDCPPGTSMEVYAGSGNLLNTDSDCTACDCQDPINQTCALSSDFNPNKAGIQPIYTRDVPCANGSATNQTTLTVPAAWDGTCSGLDVAAGGGACPGPSCNTSVKAQPATVTGGTCDPAPTGGMQSGGDPTWSEAVKACRATTLQGCDSGKTCIVRPESPYEPRVCIGKAGDQTCPAGSFSQPTQGFTGFVDSRECSQCTCGGATGGTCKVTVSLFSDVSPTACATPLATVQSGQCVDLVGNPRVSGRTFAVTTLPAGGSCPVTGGGVPSGEATPSNPTTFCCLP